MSSYDVVGPEEYNIYVFYLLPPAKVMFLHASVIVSMGGMHAMHACPLPCMPPAMHAPPTTHAPPPPCIPPTIHGPCHTHTPMIWSMSGQYASYWNASLLSLLLCFSSRHFHCDDDDEFFTTSKNTHPPSTTFSPIPPPSKQSSQERWKCYFHQSRTI